MPIRRLASGATALLLALLCACSHRPDTGHGAAATAPRDDASHGGMLYAKSCAACHGARGVNGPIGPALGGERKRRSRAQIAAAIENPDPPMPKLYPGELSHQDVADIVAYLETL